MQYFIGFMLEYPALKQKGKIVSQLLLTALSSKGLVEKTTTSKLMSKHQKASI